MIEKDSDRVSHSSFDSSTPFRKSNVFETPLRGLSQASRAIIRGSTLLLASLCALSAIPSHAVTVASNLKLSLSVNGGTAILSWTGTPGVLYQVEGAPTLGADWQAIGSPTTDFAVTNVLIAPAQLYRVGIFTNTTQYVANAVKNAGDKAPPLVPTGLMASAASCSQVNLSWNASTDQGTKAGGTTYTSALKGYNIYRGGVFLKQALAPATTTTDTSVAGSTTYSYSVLAIDNAGNSSALSSAVSVTTPACSSCTATITASSSPSGAGTISGGGAVNCGSGVSVTASAGRALFSAAWENGNLGVSLIRPDNVEISTTNAPIISE